MSSDPPDNVVQLRRAQASGPGEPTPPPAAAVAPAAQGPRELRTFIEVDGEQLKAAFPDFGTCLLAHVKRALDVGGADGRVVAVHREVVEPGVQSVRPHQKGDGCWCQPLAFTASTPRRIILVR